MRVIKKYSILSELYSRLFHPSIINLTYFWNFGIYVTLCLIIQIIIGIFLVIHYILEINCILNYILYIIQYIKYNWLILFNYDSKIILQMFLPYFFFKKTKGFSVSIFYNFFNLYKILKKYEIENFENLKKEKKWSKNYNIYYLIYILYSIFCLIIIILGFIINIIKLLLYIIFFYRFINIFITIFLNLNYFYKFLIICILIYYLYIVYLTLKQIIKKIFIYLKIFYLYFTQYKNFNIFSVISNKLLLIYFNKNIKRHIINYINDILIRSVAPEFLAEKILNQWQIIYNNSLLIRILILNNFILNFLKYLLFYCLIVSSFYNLYNLNLNEYIILLENSYSNYNININFWDISNLKNIIKYYNLLILYKFYLFLVNFYTLTLELGIPSFIIISLAYILPININNKESIKIYNLISDSNFFIEKFIGIKFIYGNFSPIILYIISILITIILIYILLNLFLQWCFYQYYNKNNIQELILQINKIVLFEILLMSFNDHLDDFKENSKNSYSSYKNNHYYSNDSFFNSQLMHNMFQIYFLYKQKKLFSDIKSGDIKFLENMLVMIEKKHNDSNYKSKKIIYDGDLYHKELNNLSVEVIEFFKYKLK